MHQIKTTLNKSLADFTYKDTGMVQILKKTLENLKFQGVTVNNNGIYMCILGALLAFTKLE